MKILIMFMFDYIKKMWKAKKGEMGGNIITILIIVIIAVNLLPVISSQISEANVSTTVKNLLTLVPLLIAVGILAGVAYSAYKKKH